MLASTPTVLTSTQHRCALPEATRFLSPLTLRSSNRLSTGQAEDPAGLKTQLWSTASLSPPTLTTAGTALALFKRPTSPTLLQLALHSRLAPTQSTSPGSCKTTPPIVHTAQASLLSTKTPRSLRLNSNCSRATSLRSSSTRSPTRWAKAPSTPTSAVSSSLHRSKTALLTHSLESWESMLAAATLPHAANASSGGKEPHRLSLQ